MSENRTVHLVEIPIGGREGAIWNRLHSEREEICEALLENGNATFEIQWLQSRLRKVDDALDRLMSGSYGNCSQCGGSITGARLDMDPALALCRECEDSGAGSSDDVVLENLKPFDTIFMHTHNSDYRILLLDPKTGRALVEGGEYLREPKEALLKGSAVLGFPFKSGALSVGSNLEMWVDERVLLTSAIRSVQVKHSAQEVARVSPEGLSPVHL